MIMKNLLLLQILFLFLFSCSNASKENALDQDHQEIPCENGCLFTVDKAYGEIIFMKCFEKYAIKTAYPDDPEMTIYGILESLEEPFQVVGKEIIFSGAFRENTLIPYFPDPAFNMESIFEMELFFIE